MKWEVRLLESDTRFPRMVKVRQNFEAPAISDIPGEVLSQLRKAELGKRIRPGERIAIAVGSRGISHLVDLVAAVVEEVKALGANPFIVPAMGSHGGATPEGQKELLEGYGVTEGRLGAPIVSSMEVVEIGETESGIPVLFSSTAASSDGIIIINRIKPHTDFHGEIESGLIKMLVIGLGKHRGASLIHKKGAEGLREIIPQAGRVILSKMPVRLGLATVENAYDHPAVIRAIPPEEFESMERELLKQAKLLMPRLPSERIDVLIVEEIGKNISGAGMDTNIIGRIMITGQPDLPSPRITRIVVLDITRESHGNAAGLGIADVIPYRVIEKLDYNAFAINTITSTFLERGKIPLTLPTDREAIRIALETCWNPPPERARVIRIKNTLKLDEIYVSEGLLEDLRKTEAIREGRLEVLGEPEEMEFTPDGALVRRW